MFNIYKIFSLIKLKIQVYNLVFFFYYFNIYIYYGIFMVKVFCIYKIVE